MNATILLLALLLQLPPAPQSGKSSVEGAVVRSGSGEPVSGIRVTLTRPPDPSVPAVPAVRATRPPDPVPTTKTDAQGKFAFKNLDAGSYRMAFSGNGYVRQEYGQKSSPGQGTPIEVVAGQTLKDLVMRLTPTAGVSGRVLNAEKQPAAAVPVHLMRFTFDANGLRTIQPAASTQTDDRGNYRIYFLTPGRYYLAAGTLREATPARPFNGAMETHAITYYPGATDPGQATPIDIRPAAELSMDLALVDQSRYRIRGRVVDPRLAQPPSSVRIALTYRGNAGAGSYEVTGSSITYTASDGTFEVRDILPGAYLLAAIWGDSVSIPNSFLGTGAALTPDQIRQQNNDPALRDAQRARTNDALNTIMAGIAYAPLDVMNSNIENLVLTIAPGGSISGRIRIDGRDSAANSGLERLKLQLKPSLNGLPSNNPVVYAPRVEAIAPDGTFQIPHTKVGEYRISVTDMPPGFYVKEARVGPVDVLNQPLQFAASGALEIVMRPGAGAITGVVSNERLDPMPGAQVVLVPERLRDRLDLFKTTTADSRGTFAFDNVAPGDYKVFSWEALEPYAYFDSALLKDVESKGKLVHVEELSKQTADLRVIPANTP